jgi:hypothetical protein
MTEMRMGSSTLFSIWAGNDVVIKFHCVKKKKRCLRYSTLIADCRLVSWCFPFVIWVLHILKRLYQVYGNLKPFYLPWELDVFSLWSALCVQLCLFRWNFFFFWWYGGLSSGPHAVCAGVLPLEPLRQSHNVFLSNVKCWGQYPGLAHLGKCSAHELHLQPCHLP